MANWATWCRTEPGSAPPRPSRPFVGRDRRGVGDVEGGKLCLGRNGDQAITFLRRQPAQSLALGAEHDAGAAGKIEIADGGVAALVEPVEPEARLLELLEGARE